ncbi:RagB/SusD family nutrient uptake outer membrane protein [Bacteroides sp.]|uniref:RagB/SusD family nutrient uptake outer membrane protein n=1 Tax=Bacteroides sp. TaxID=29523 RepID=UPI00261FA5FE|nr:RagB/SusD family nutrient uptake outer membrane protein [Bacteroides sp.]MDD3039994.1 RagB/SusD family nutrient uptake outer membrane protein [Bacteroides sp.]
MRIYSYFVGLISIFVLTACSDWLDIQPQDTTEDDQLFETGGGYRNALNGIYRQMSNSSMYGKELTWGALDAMAQYYSPKYGTNEDYFSTYKYTGSQIYPVVQDMWSKTYNCIANCNNLIQRVSKESATTFIKGEEERLLIEGEALALRAILHFDMYRLFAPAKEDGKKYLPYVDIYPCTFKEYITSEELLRKVTVDLKDAKDLVGRFDIPRSSWMEVGVRFKNDHQGITTTEKPNDLFFAYRGYRLNYYAICGMLARVYLYRGMYKEAFDETELVINAISDKYGSSLFDFTNSSEFGQGNNKMYDELLFCLSNQMLADNYQNYRYANSLNLYSYNPKGDWFDDDSGDIRGKVIAADGWYYYCTKYLVADGTLSKYAKDMIPMLRLGEMYHIRAAYYNNLAEEATDNEQSKAYKNKAVEEIAVIRRGHGCATDIVDSSSSDWFKTELIKEARREFMGEGQLFYYFKRLNVPPKRGFKPESFVLPYPQNETL